MGGKIRLPVLGDFPIADEIIVGPVLTGPHSSTNVLGVWRNAVRASSVMGL